MKNGPEWVKTVPENRHIELFVLYARHVQLRMNLLIYIYAPSFSLHVMKDKKLSCRTAVAYTERRAAWLRQLGLLYSAYV